MYSVKHHSLFQKSLEILILFFILNICHADTPKSYDVQGPLNQPKIFAEGVISTGDYDSHPAFSPDGKTLFFVKMGPDLTKWTIFVSNFQNGKWSNPEIAPFSGHYWDADPQFSKDGNTLYFISSRPLKEGDPPKDFDIWKSEKVNNSWSKPVRLPAPINSEVSEYYPTLTDDGTMYFGSRRKGGKGASDIYRSRLENGEYKTAENLGDAINTPGNEFEPFISADEKFLIFMATPSESLDQADFFISHYENGNWSKALKLPEPFNSPVTEFSPKVTHDGKYFFFSSNRNIHADINKLETTAELMKRIRSAGNGLCDIYQVDFSALQNAISSKK